MPDGKNGGIVRYGGYGWIRLEQYKDDQRHGLEIYWGGSGNFRVSLNKNDQSIGNIFWNTNNWTEKNSRNKDVFDTILSIDDFRP